MCPNLEIGGGLDLSNTPFNLTRVLSRVEPGRGSCVNVNRCDPGRPGQSPGLLPRYEAGSDRDLPVFKIPGLTQLLGVKVV